MIKNFLKYFDNDEIIGMIEGDGRENHGKKDFFVLSGFVYRFLFHL